MEVNKPKPIETVYYAARNVAVYFSMEGNKHLEAIKDAFRGRATDPSPSTFRQAVQAAVDGFARDAWNICHLLKPIHQWHVEANTPNWINWDVPSYQLEDSPYGEVLRSFKSVADPTVHLGDHYEDASHHKLVIDYCRRFLLLMLEAATLPLIDNPSEYWRASPDRHPALISQRDWLETFLRGDVESRDEKISAFAELLLPSFDVDSDESITQNCLILHAILEGENHRGSILIPKAEWARVGAMLDRELRLATEAAAGLTDKEINSEGKSSDQYRPSRLDERDRWILSQKLTGYTRGQILTKLKEHPKTKSDLWDQIETVQGISAAIKRAEKLPMKNPD